MDKPNLADIRTDIDALDGELRALLRKRVALVAEVARAKPARGDVPIRPAREAQQWREIVAWYEKENKGEGAGAGVPLTLLFAIWRELVSAALAQQLASEGGLRVQVPDVLLLRARDYFGASARYDTGEGEIKICTADKLPAPKDGCAVFARLPNLGGSDENEPAFCYGKVPLEESGDDATLIKSSSPMGEVLVKYGADYICELQGFLRAQDVRSAQWLGAYPRLVFSGAQEREEKI